VSWLPLTCTGLLPATVNTAVEAAGCVAGVEWVACADGDGRVGRTAVGGGGPVAGGVAEHDAVSAAITHRDTTAMPFFNRLSGRSRMAQACHGR